MTRRILNLRWSQRRGYWICPELKEAGRQKVPFIRWLAELLKSCWQAQRQPGQLKVFGKNGKIQFERTYGQDPRRDRG